jgi:TRAP-type transport system small permease protein
MNALDKGYRLFGYLKVAGAIISGLSIFGMMLFIVYDVVGRNFLGGSIRGGFEIVQNYFMPVAIFPAIGYVYSSGITPKMDLLMPKTPKRLQAAAVYVLLVLELAIFSLLVYFTWGYAVTGMERGMTFPAAGSLYPVWPLLFLVPFGFALVLVETLFVLARNVFGDRVGLAMDQVIYETD